MLAGAEGLLDDPQRAASILQDILEGGPKRRHSLVPTGRPPPGGEPVKSFAGDPYVAPFGRPAGMPGMTTEEMLLGMKPYLPLHVTLPEPRKRLATALAAMAAHSAGRGYRQAYGD